MKEKERTERMKNIGYILAVFGLGILLCACSPKHSGTESAAKTPTGYPSDEVQRQTVYYDGKLYWYQFDGFDNPLQEGFELAGTVEEVFTKEYPSSEYGGTRVEAGQEIYANPSEPSRIYVKYEKGYARFEDTKDPKE